MFLSGLFPSEIQRKLFGFNEVVIISGTEPLSAWEAVEKNCNNKTNL